MQQNREKILVVDDEDRIVGILRAYLEKEGYRVLAARDGQEAMALAGRENPDLIVLDLMLPGMPGWDVCRELRRTSSVPVIMLTARDDDTDKIVGLELGADDYMTKPFNPKELVARVHAVLRRAKPAPAAASRVLSVGKLAVDADRHEVRVGDQPVALTPSEFTILETLAANPGRVYSRLQLLERVQGEAFEGYERTIDSHVKNLRQKIEADPRRPQLVLTVFGIGYKFTEHPDA
ncbi:MAG: response regulator transcription factor [Dehalococcoidales bacterium]|nr:response regulator transcription factor [Dehalococcoidales bacterium]